MKTYHLRSLWATRNQYWLGIIRMFNRIVSKIEYYYYTTRKKAVWREKGNKFLSDFRHGHVLLNTGAALTRQINSDCNQNCNGFKKRRTSANGSASFIALSRLLIRAHCFNTIEFDTTKARRSNQSAAIKCDVWINCRAAIALKSNLIQLSSTRR